MGAFLACAGLAAHVALAADVAVDPSLAPLYYTLNAKSEAVDGSAGLGLAVGLVSDAYKRAHEQFLSALQAQTAAGSTPPLLQRLACIDVPNPGKGCRRLVPLDVKPDAKRDTGPDAAAMAPVLGAEPSRSALVLTVTVIFDGRFFQMPTHLNVWHLNEQGVPSMSRDLGVSYISTYSKSQHEADIASKRNDTPFAGKIGTKEARAHYWLGGSQPRLPAELDKSAGLITTLYSAALAPDATGILAGDDSGRKSFPTVKSVVASEKAKCSTLHGDFRVVKDQGDVLWLVFPSDAKAVRNVFYIEPRCSFDY